MFLQHELNIFFFALPAFIGARNGKNIFQIRIFLREFFKLFFIIKVFGETISKNIPDFNVRFLVEKRDQFTVFMIPWLVYGAALYAWTEFSWIFDVCYADYQNWLLRPTEWKGF